MTIFRAIAVSLAVLPAVSACQTQPPAITPSTQATPATADPATTDPGTAELEALMDRWMQVWHEGRYELVPTCVNEQYIRHDQKGDRVVTREAYTAEIRQTHAEAPDIHFEMHDQTFAGDRIWTRFTMTWTDRETGKLASRTGLQEYRVENGKLAETWVLLSPAEARWPDMPAR